MLAKILMIDNGLKQLC